MRVLLLSVVFSASLTTVVAAQPSKPTDVTKMAKDDCARARAQNKTCVLTIDDGDAFEGNAPKGDGDMFSALDWIKAKSLIRIRRDFIQEIIKSAEDL